MNCLVSSKGLATLCDTSSVDWIIDAVSKEEIDLQQRPYLEALGKIKGDKAKATVESFRGSKEKLVRKLVAKLLEQW